MLQVVIVTNYVRMVPSPPAFVGTSLYDSWTSILESSEESVEDRPFEDVGGFKLSAFRYLLTGKWPLEVVAPRRKTVEPEFPWICSKDSTEHNTKYGPLLPTRFLVLNL